MSAGSFSKQKLIDLAKQIQDAMDKGKSTSKLLAKLQAEVPYPNVSELFSTDYPAEYIIDYAMKWKKEWPKLSQSELTELVRKIMNAEGKEADIKVMVRTFEANCLHPAKSDLIYYPDEHFDGDPDPSPDRIVQKALSGK